MHWYCWLGLVLTAIALFWNPDATDDEEWPRHD